MLVEELVARLGLEIDDVAFSKADALIGGLQKSWLAFGGALAAGMAVAAAAVAKATANAADEAGKLAQRTGLDSTFLQELGYAADLADVSMEQLGTGLQRLAKSGVKDLRAEIFKIRDHFQKLPADGRRVAYLMEKFGRSGAQMAPLFKEGGDALEDLFQRAHDSGTVFTPEEIAQAEDFNDSITELGRALQGLAFDIGKKLIPPLTKAFKVARDWVIAVRKWKAPLEGIKQVLKGVAFVMGGILLATITANAVGLAFLAKAYLFAGTSAMWAGIKAAASWIAAAAPIAGLAVLFAVLLAAIEDVWVFLQGGDSLIGELGPKWTKWLDEFLKPLPGEHWAITLMKAILKGITDIQGAWRVFKGELSLPAFLGIKKGDRFPGQVGVNTGDYVPDQSAANGDFLHRAAGLLFKQPTYYVPAPVGGPSVTNAPTVVNNVTVNAQTNADPQQIAGVVREELSSSWRSAAAGTSEGP